MAEKAYIEREAAIKVVCENCNKLFPEEPCEPSDCAIMQMLRSIPAADVRPVVLCRECQNSYEWANVDGDSYRYCGYLRSRWNRDNDRMVYDDDFCKWGKKREES